MSASAKDPYVDLAERIFIAPEPGLRHARVIGGEKPDPKALAAFSFRLAEAFEAATQDTERVKAQRAAATKAAVKLDEVDLSNVIRGTGKS